MERNTASASKDQHEHTPTKRNEIYTTVLYTEAEKHFKNLGNGKQDAHDGIKHGLLIVKTDHLYCMYISHQKKF